MDLGQTGNDDLQSAIDGIVSGASDAAAPADAAAAGAGPDLGVPPVPPEAPDFSAMAAPAPEAPTEEPVVAPEEPAVAPESLIPEPEPAMEIAPEPAAPAGDLAEVKAEMVKELLPIIDKVDVESEKKFDLYKEAIESTHDKSMIPAAHEAAKAIADDTKKAEALLYLINEAE